MYMRVLRARPGMLPRMPIWFGRVSVSHTLTVAQGSGARRPRGLAGGRERREDGDREQDR